MRAGGSTRLAGDHAVGVAVAEPAAVLEDDERWGEGDMSHWVAGTGAESMEEEEAGAETEGFGAEENRASVVVGAVGAEAKVEAAAATEVVVVEEAEEAATASALGFLA